MSAFQSLLRALGPWPIRRIVSTRERVAVRVDPAIYLTALTALQQPWQAGPTVLPWSTAVSRAG